MAPIGVPPPDYDISDIGPIDEVLSSIGPYAGKTERATAQQANMPANEFLVESTNLGYVYVTLRVRTCEVLCGRRQRHGSKLLKILSSNWEIASDSALIHSILNQTRTILIEREHSIRSQ